jgi:hypothetical protein
VDVERFEQGGAEALALVRRAGRRDQDLAGARLALGVAQHEQRAALADDEHLA